jgi:hypothetical protein
MRCRSSVRIHGLLLAGLCSCLLSGFSYAMSDPFVEETAAPSARIVLRDDSVIFGDVVDIAEGTVRVSTFWMGEVTIPMASIATLESEREIELLTTDDRLIALSRLRFVDGEVLIEGEDSIPIEQLSVSDPESWEAGQGYHTTGRASTSFDYNRGNTDTDEINADLEIFLESRRDRFTLRGDLEDTSTNITTEENGETSRINQTTADNWQLTGKYDYFLADPRNYLGVNLGLNSDEFADIRQRYYVGPYYGRKLFSRDDLKLDAELGISYVDTDFIEEEDNDYFGANINITGETSFLDGALTLYLRQVTIMNLSTMSKSIYRTTAGLRFPLLLGLEAGAEVSADYDGGAAEGKKKHDETLTFRVGYKW